VAAAGAIDAFLDEAIETHAELAAMESRRPPVTVGNDDPWAQAMRDLAAIEDAYQDVRDRLGVVVMRFAARSDMEEVASAAGAVSHKARAFSLSASELRALLDEILHAESAILMATPPELDARALSDALARGATALGGSDGAALDELLRALREVA